MKKKAKIITFLALILLVVLVVIANVMRGRSLVRSVQVSIDYPGADTLVTAEQVVKLVSDSLPSLGQQKVKDVDLQAVKRVVASSPFLIDCDASTTIGGSVMVYARQRRPIVRVCSSERQYYIDETGAEVPLGNVGNSDVIVANGAIPYSGKLKEELYTLAYYLDTHKDISPLFDQIYCSEKGDFYLTPKLGSHVVQLGKPTDLDKKFRNLLALYSQGMPLVGWDAYSQVSVKYRKQVVCTRRNP